MLIWGRDILSEPDPNANAVPQGQSIYDVDKENEGGKLGYFVVE